MMKIDIDKLTEAELVDLNNRIVERLRFLNQMRAHADMLEFRIGDRVSFQPQGRGPVAGMLTRYNRKTVTIITDDGQHWNVSPQFCLGSNRPRSTNRTTRMSFISSQSKIRVPPNHAFNRTRRYGPSTWRAPVAAGRLTWSR